MSLLWSHSPAAGMKVLESEFWEAWRLIQGALLLVYDYRVRTMILVCDSMRDPESCGNVIMMSGKSGINLGDRL